MAESSAIESFRDLVVWQVAMDAVDKVLQLVAEEPINKKYWLCDQVSRSTTSIAANIAEGHGSGSRRMYTRHLYIARGSLNETLTFMEIIRRQKYATAEELMPIRDLLHRTHKLLNGLIKSLQHKDSKE